MTPSAIAPPRAPAPAAKAKAPDNAKAEERERLVQLALASLAEVGGKLTAEEDIVFRGAQIVLPETMDLAGAITFLDEKRREDEKTINYSRRYNFRPYDGARATHLALKKAFGMVAQRGVPTWWGTEPPQLITINTSPTDTEQVPWGGLAVAHLPGLVLYVGSTDTEEYGPVFQLTAKGPRKYRHHVEGVFRLVEEELNTNSLYRGSAFDGQDMPCFLDLSGVNPSKVIYSAQVQADLDAHVWSIIRYPETMQQAGVPLKRAVLLEGPYGTGKTLAAYLTAQIAQANGWTFIMCRPGRDNLFTVMATARLYQPAVVFFEDVDVLAGVEEADHIRQLLDIFDGIQSKGTRIVCVLTTNHAERIHKGMVRPGRLDAIIHVGSLDHAGIRALVEATVPADLLSDEIDWQAVGDSMEGYVPAFCREAIDRTVRYNIARNGGMATPLATQDFVNAAGGLRPQLALMEDARDEFAHDPLSQSLGKVIERVLEKRVEGAQVTGGAWDMEVALAGSGAVLG